MSGAADREEGISAESFGLEDFDAGYREGFFRGNCIWCEDRGVSFVEAESSQYLLLHIHPREVLWRHFRDRLVQALLRKLHLSALLAMYIFSLS